MGGRDDPEVEALLGEDDWVGRTNRTRLWAIWCFQQEFTGNKTRAEAIEAAESIWGVSPDGARDYPPNEELETWCPEYDGT